MLTKCEADLVLWVGRRMLRVYLEQAATLARARRWDLLTVTLLHFSTFRTYCRDLDCLLSYSPTLSPP